MFCRQSYIRFNGSLRHTHIVGVCAHGISPLSGVLHRILTGPRETTSDGARDGFVKKRWTSQDACAAKEHCVEVPEVVERTSPKCCDPWSWGTQ